MATNLRTDAAGAFKRHDSAHRHIVGEDPDFPAAAGRYHLYVALACPWAAASLQVLHMKGLEGAITYSIVHPTWGRTRPEDPKDDHYGWIFRHPGDPPVAGPTGHGANACDSALVPDPEGAKTMREVYNRGGVEPGPFTTPLLFDKQRRRIVSNESMDVMRMLNGAFNAHAKHPDVDLYPAEHEAALQALNDELVYPHVNNGVYRCGFAKAQEPYEAAVEQLFAALDTLETRLTTSRYLAGKQFTWLDLRLYQTLVRFDPVYHTYFKCNKKRIADYPALWGFTRDVYQTHPSVRAWTNMAHIKTHYYTSHPTLNTFGIVPAGTGADLDEPHGREALGA